MVALRRVEVGLKHVGARASVLPHRNPRGVERLESELVVVVAARLPVDVALRRVEVGRPKHVVTGTTMKSRPVASHRAPVPDAPLPETTSSPAPMTT